MVPPTPSSPLWPYLRRCVLAFCGAIACVGVFAPTAGAVEPPAPALTGTNPPSPNVSTAPRIFGSADGVITLAVPSAVGSGPVAQANNPSFTITIYTDSNCAGPVAASGTSAELEGSGIQVTVAPDSTTTFFATQTDPSDPGNPSLCSTPGLTYTQAAPPNPPTVTAVSPVGPADDNSPHVIGSADSGATVSIYANAACSGSPLGSGTDSDFAGGGIEVSVPDNSTTDFYAAAFNKGVPSTCSTSSVTYQEVTPPDSGGGGGGGEEEAVVGVPPGAPKLRTVPGGRANDNAPMLTGSAPGASSVEVFDNAGCNGPPVAGGSAAQFAGGGLQVERRRQHDHRLLRRRLDSGGNASACSPTPAVYTEDSIAPRTRITLGPGSKTRRHVRSSASPTSPRGRHQVPLQARRRKWKSCHAPLEAQAAARHRRHTVRVKADDAAGNREKRGVKRRFQVDRPPAPAPPLTRRAGRRALG